MLVVVYNPLNLSVFFKYLFQFSPGGKCMDEVTACFAFISITYSHFSGCLDNLLLSSNTLCMFNTMEHNAPSMAKYKCVIININDIISNRAVIEFTNGY